MPDILVVDDNPDACEMMTRLVAASGHRGASAASGEEALDYVVSNRVDLVILDNMMPGINGIEVLRRMKLDPRTRDIPVVMWSAIGDREFREHVVRKGAADYWVKSSFDYSALGAMIERALGAVA